MSQTHLRLIWINEAIAADVRHKGPRNRETHSNQADTPRNATVTPSWYVRTWNWLNNYGSAISAIGVLAGLIASVVAFFAYVYEPLIRLENLDNAINGSLGRKG